jgi:pimeloyl-ACP methyl ester carboxylesterase
MNEERKQFIQLLKTDFKKGMQFFIEDVFPELNVEPHKRMGLDIVMRPGVDVAVRYLHIMSQNEGIIPVHKIKPPTLIVYGSLDSPRIIENSIWLADSILHAKLVEIKDAGHVPIVTKPYEVVEAINDVFR